MKMYRLDHVSVKALQMKQRYQVREFFFPNAQENDELMK